MGLGVVADLVAHPRRQDELAAVFESGFQLAFHAEKNVSFFAPMVGKVAGRIVDHTHPNLIILFTEKPRAPIGHAGFAFVLGAFDVRPVGRAKRKCSHLHIARSCPIGDAISASTPPPSRADAGDTARPDAAHRAARGPRRTVSRATCLCCTPPCSARAGSIPAPASPRYPRNRRATLQR